MAYKSILFRNKAAIIVSPIQDNDFNDLKEFSALVDRQALDKIIVTKETWQKLELLISPKED